MFSIDTNDNSIQPLMTKSFLEMGFKERQHLQEWIAKYPSCLGEELLIIQKEFAGFSDTQERLDLLALDKRGQIVIIENKLDDAGKDVTWQALKYASYCSGLKTENICTIFQEYLDKTDQPGNSSEIIEDFLDVGDILGVTLNRGVSQRIMMIAANFRKEVTSTVLWLMNFKLQVQCFKVTLWLKSDELFLNVEQIIPVKDIKDFMIGLADKAQDEVKISSAVTKQNAIRRKFWGEVIEAMQTKSSLYHNITAGVAHFISAGSGTSSVSFNFVASGKFGRAEIYINRREQVENKYFFDQLLTQREKLENDFGGSLVWERLDHRIASRIKVETEGNISERSDWHRMIEFMTNAMQRIENVFRAPLLVLDEDLRNRSNELEQVISPEEVVSPEQLDTLDNDGK